MYTGVFFLIEAIFYMILLMVIYFRKKVYKSKENKVYSILVIACFFELILELVLDYVGPLYQIIPNISYFVARLYCAALELWLTLVLCYVLTVSLCMNKKEKYIYLLKIVFIILMLGSATLNFLLPLNFMYDGNIAYTYGPSVNVIYITAFLYSFIGIIALILNIKNIKDRRFLPILLFLVLGGISSYIQMKYPGLLLATGVHAFITFFMYFTIENPDVKILEELHRAKEITDNSNEEKTMFLYDMTNDIRKTNKEINNSTNKIVEELSNEKIDKEYIKECLRDIKSSTNKFVTMTNEVFDVSQIDSATIKIYDDKYNIKTVIKELISIYNEKAKEKDLKFRSKIASDLPDYLYGDSLGIKNILTIILDNSIKYTNKGFIELNVNAIIKGDIVRLIIEIEDSGCGIEAEKLNSIFNETSESNNKNSLCTARKMLTLMGGVIIPSSNYGSGTTMKIVLDQKIVNNNNVEYTKLYNKNKILLIENNESSKKIVKKILDNTNIELECIDLGKTAIDKIRNKSKYDLILISEDLEPLNGIEINKKLKNIPGFNTNTILVTKHNEYEYNNKYLEYGFSNYLIKPIKKEKLYSIIEKYIK